MKPGTTYFYRVGDGDSWGETLSFVVPATGPQMAMSVFGDMGYQNSSVRPMQVAVSGLVKTWSASPPGPTLMLPK